MQTLTVDFQKLLTTANRLGQGLVRVELGAKLVKIGNVQFSAMAHGSALRLQTLKQNRNQRGLTHAIGSNQANPVAAHDDGGKIVDDGTVRIGKTHPLGFDDQLPRAFGLFQFDFSLTLAVAPLRPFVA